MAENRNVMRVVGFSLLSILFVSIAFVFYMPQVLVGPLGLVFPIGLFVLLLVAFYLLIISTKD